MYCLSRKSIFTFRATTIISTPREKAIQGRIICSVVQEEPHYRDREDIEEFSTSNAESLFVHRDTGFLWMEIHEASATFRFYDKAGDLLYEKQLEQQD